MLHHLTQGHAELGLLHEEPPNEVLGPVADGRVRGELEVYGGDALVRVAVARGLEGRASEEELVAEHAQAPDVHCVVVGLTGQHFRGQVVESPTQSLPAAIRRVDGPAKICDLQLPPQTQ